MKKTFLQGVTTVAIFVLVWFIATQVNWIELFQTEKVGSKIEEELGETIWKIIENDQVIIDNESVEEKIDSIVGIICRENYLPGNEFKVYVVKNDDVNAFALPDGYIIIYSGLILECDNVDQLTGVIAHEMAHINLDHIMKKLVKEIGLATLVTISSGGSGSDMARESFRLLSSTAFDRSMEKEADIKAVDYMLKAGNNPAPLADFFYKLTEYEMPGAEYLGWVSTHPALKERAEYIVEYYHENKKEDHVYKPLLSESSWDDLQLNLRNTK